MSTEVKRKKKKKAVITWQETTQNTHFDETL